MHVMRKTLLIVFAAVILMGIGVLFLRRWGLNTFGTGYDPNKRQDVRKLIVIADDSRPVRELLERFRHDQGRYPEVLSNLFPTYLHATNSPGDFTDWNGWRYEGASNSYTLRYQVNWDEGFFL